MVHVVKSVTIDLTSRHRDGIALAAGEWPTRLGWNWVSSRRSLMKRW
jgi:hypothetical protein